MHVGRGIAIVTDAMVIDCYHLRCLLLAEHTQRVVHRSAKMHLREEKWWIFPRNFVEIKRYEKGTSDKEVILRDAIKIYEAGGPDAGKKGK